MEQPQQTGRAQETSHFASDARAAIEKFVAESRTSSAVWKLGLNAAWVRMPREGGLWFYVGLRRHLDWVTGEVAMSPVPVDLEALEPWTGSAPANGAGYRIRLSDLLHEEDRWWASGTTARERRECLEWIALQLRVKSDMQFERHPLTAGPGDSAR